MAVAVILILVGSALIWPAAVAGGASIVAASAGTDGATPDVTPDQGMTVPSEPVDDGTLSAATRLIAFEADALRTLDADAYRRVFAAGDVSAQTGGVAGDPSDRAIFNLFRDVPAGSAVDFSSVTPIFISPGADGTVEVLARHLLAYRQPDGERKLVEVSALERLVPAGHTVTAPTPDEGDLDGIGWRVADWTVAEEEEARKTWLVWLDGRVDLEPFDGRLKAEMSYTLFPGYSGSASDSLPPVVFDLAGTFRVDAVRDATGELEWEQEADSLTVWLREDTAADRPLVVTVSYEGKVDPVGDARGNLEYLGAEAIYLRPASGWYPRLTDAGAVRGSVAVTVPGWWAVAAPGRLLAATPEDSTGYRTFTWGLDLPAELYLSAGSYLVHERHTAAGVTIRTFLYAREAEWAEAYAAEAERILDFYSERFGPYPYPNLTLSEVQDFYYGGLSARTFVLLEKMWLGDPAWDSGSRYLLAHEISHQWWGEIVPVGDDPEWFLWEGLASYCEALWAEQESGPAARQFVMDQMAANYAGAARYHEGWTIGEANDRIQDWQEQFVYDKGAWVFQTLRFLLGDDAFFGVLRDYVNDFAGHPATPPDLAGLIAQAAPGDDYLAGFLQLFTEEPGDPDLALTSLSVHRSAGPASEPGSEPGAAGTAESVTGKAYTVDLTLADLGPTGFPRAEVRVNLRDGTSETFQVEAGPAELSVAGTVRSVEVDPDHEILDLNRGNNSWHVVMGVGIPDEFIDPLLGTAVVLAIICALAVILSRRRRARLRVGRPSGGQLNVNDPLKVFPGRD